MTARETAGGFGHSAAPEGELRARLAREPELPDGLCHCQYAPWDLSQQILVRFAAGLGFDLKQLGQSRVRFFDYLCADPALQADVLSSCRPLEIDYGEVAMFDARLLHATEENSEATTRISLDFRLLSIPAWEKQVERFEENQIAPCYPWQEPHKGRFYDTRTAFEL